jgi:hypothetical protein
MRRKSRETENLAMEKETRETGVQERRGKNRNGTKGGGLI